MTSARRKRYSTWQKQEIVAHYQSLRTNTDKIRFCLRVGIYDELGQPSVDRLYNLACRLGVSGRKDFSKVVTDETLLQRRDDPERTVFDEASDRYIRQEWGRAPLAAVAAHLDLSEPAVAYRARQLGLRKPNWPWDVRKVAAWLGMTLPELRARAAEGLDIFALRGRRNGAAIEIVTAPSLGRWLLRPGVADELAEQDADRFFIADVLESLADIVARKATMPKCHYLLCGDICCQPRTALFGRYCTSWKSHEAGDDKKCNARHMPIAALTQPPDEPFAVRV